MNALLSLLLVTFASPDVVPVAEAAVVPVSLSLDSEPESALTAVQDELLELAFGAASALPLEPHIKNRARSQEAVVLACLALDQPERALRYAEQIPNWRKGACFAEYAAYRAERGELDDVFTYLDLAHEISEGSEGELKQAWRRDRIRAKIAKTYSLLGQTAQAARFAAGLSESEVGEVALAEARLTSPDAMEERLAQLERALGVGEFEGTKTSIFAMAELHRTFYADEEKRALIESRIQASDAKLPVLLRLDARMELVETALDADDHVEARRLVDEALEVFFSYKWQAEHGVPIKARLAALRHRAGDEAGALKELEAALGMYDAGERTIIGMFRAATLRPVAEAYSQIGREEEARETYRRVVELGAVNPNARPRAMDLAATCASMAVNGFGPSDELLERVRALESGLGDPW